MRRSPVDVALGCYPAWWRQRYGDEVRLVVADLMGQGRTARSLAADLARDALRTRMHARGMPHVPDLWAARTRHLLAVASLLPVLITPLMLAMMGSVNLHASEGKIFPSEVSVPTPTSYDIFVHGHLPFIPVTPPLAAQVAAWAGMAVGLLFLMCLGTVTTGWLRMRRAVRRPGTTSQRALRRLAAVPAATLLVAIFLFAGCSVVSPRGYESHGGRPPIPLGGDPSAAHALTIALHAVMWAGWLASVAAVAVVSHRARLSVDDLGTGTPVAGALAGTLAGMVLALTVRYVSLRLASPVMVHGVTITATASLLPVWPLLLGGMVVTTAVAVGAAVGARRSYRVVLDCS